MSKPTAPTDQPRASRGRLIDTLIVAAAAVMQLILAVPFTAASGLLAPQWGVTLAWTIWVVGAVALFVMARRTPRFTPAVPIVNAALLWGLLVFGERVLGWVA